MTRIFTDGAEMGDVLFFDARTCSVVNDGPAGSGPWSYQISNITEQKWFDPLSEFHYRFRVKDNSVGNNHVVLGWRNSSTELGSIRMGQVAGLNKFLVYTSTGTLVATSAFNYLQAVWYTVEVYVKIADGTNGRIVVKLEGAVDSGLDYTGDTKPGADTTVNNFRYTTGYNSGFRIDDLALNDTNGGVDNGWCGDGHVIAIKPNANGDSSQFVGSDADSTNNYQLVDEVPASGTDYVESATSGEQDLYNLEACGLTNATILRVWPEARGIDTVAEGGQVYLPIKTGGTQYNGTAVTLLTSYTKALRGDIRTVNPNGGAAWTPSDLDAIQIGVKVV